MIPVKAFFSIAMAGVFAAAWWGCTAKKLLWQGLILSLFHLAFMVVAVITAPRTLVHHRGELVTSGSAGEVGWTIALVHNGIGFYACWAFFTVIFNFGVVMIYVWGASMTTASVVCLLLIAAEIVIESVLDNFLQYEQRKYLFSEYFIMIFVLVCMLNSNIDTQDSITAVIGVLLMLVIGTLACKVLRIVRKNRKKRKERNPPKPEPVAVTPPEVPTVMGQMNNVMPQDSNMKNHQGFAGMVNHMPSSRTLPTFNNIGFPQSQHALLAYNSHSLQPTWMGNQLAPQTYQDPTYFRSFAGQSLRPHITETNPRATVNDINNPGYTKGHIPGRTPKSPKPRTHIKPARLSIPKPNYGGNYGGNWRFTTGNDATRPFPAIGMVARPHHGAMLGYNTGMGGRVYNPRAQDNSTPLNIVLKV